MRRWLLLAAALTIVMAADAEAACTISTTGVNFGTYNVFDTAPVDSTGTITFKCDLLNFNISVALSTGSSGTFFPREMRRGSDRLPYNLFRDASRTTVWGNGTGGTSQYTNVWPLGQRIDLTVYGRVFPGADVSAGNYTDTVTAIVNF